MTVKMQKNNSISDAYSAQVLARFAWSANKISAANKGQKMSNVVNMNICNDYNKFLTAKRIMTLTTIMKM